MKENSNANDKDDSDSETKLEHFTFENLEIGEESNS